MREEGEEREKEKKEDKAGVHSSCIEEHRRHA